MKSEHWIILILAAVLVYYGWRNYSASGNPLSTNAQA
jgi:hypothetical protein